MLLRSTLIYLPALLLPRIATFVLVIVATRLLPIGEYGLFALVTVVGEIAEGVSTNWVRIALLRLSGGGTTFPASLWGEAARANRRTTAAALVCAGPVAFLLVPDRPVAFWLAVVAYVVTTALLRFGLHVLQATGCRETYARVEVSRAVATLAFPVAAVAMFGADFLTASLAGSAATFIFADWALLVAWRRVASTERIVGAREFRTFAAPVVTVTGIGYVIASIERMLLQVLAGAAAVGGYSAAHALARQPLEVLGNAVNAGGFPQLVKRYERDGTVGAKDAVAIQLDLLLTLLLPAVAGVAALRGAIAGTVLPVAYGAVAAAVLPPVALGAACFTLRGAVFDNILHLQKRSWTMLSYLVPSALVSIGVALITIPTRGAEGAAWAFAAGSAVSVPLSIAVVRDLVPTRRAMRSGGRAGATALVVGVSAEWVAAIVPPIPFVQLGAGVLVGSLCFLLSQAALRPRQVKIALRRRARLARFSRTARA